MTGEARGQERRCGASARMPDTLANLFISGIFRILALVEDFTRECLARGADTSLSGQRLVAM